MSGWSPFEALSAAQCEKLEAYQRLLLRFNRKINLISREDEANVRAHIRHALALSWRRFPAGSVVVDWGAGGGLPAIPLAVCFPEIEVHAVDAVGKKAQAVRAMGRRLALENLSAWHGRAETWPGSATHSISRATAPLEMLWTWHRRVAREEEQTSEGSEWAPGLLCLKGGDLKEEFDTLIRNFANLRVETYDLASLLENSSYEEKKLIHVKASPDRFT